MTNPVPERPEPLASTEKKRHGCLSIYLIVVILANGLSSIVNFVQINKIMTTYNTSYFMVFLLVLLGLLNIVSAVLIVKWKKIGFYLFILSSLAAFIVNVVIGLNVFTSLFGLVGIALLFGVLQIGEKDEKGWPQLD